MAQSIGMKIEGLIMPKAVLWGARQLGKA